MATIVRVKRSIHDEPLGALVLSARKRRRLEDDGNGEVEEKSNAPPTDTDKADKIRVLKLAGTVTTHDVAAATNVAFTNKEVATQMVGQKAARQPINVVERARQEQRQNANENRFRIVNRLRATVNEEESDKEDTAVGGLVGKKEVTILDIEKEVNEQEAKTSAQGPFVYDIYEYASHFKSSNYMPAGAELEDHELRVNEFEVFFEDHYNVLDEDSDSEDSNCENYFTNDYPDDDFLENDGFNESYDDGHDYGKKLARMKLYNDSDDEDDDQEDKSSDSTDVFGDVVDPYGETEYPTATFNFVHDVDDLDEHGGASGSNKQNRILKRMKTEKNEDADRDDEDDEFQSANED